MLRRRAAKKRVGKNTPTHTRMTYIHTYEQPHVYSISFDGELQIEDTKGGLFGAVARGNEAWFGVDGYPAKIIHVSLGLPAGVYVCMHVQTHTWYPGFAGRYVCVSVYLHVLCQNHACFLGFAGRYVSVWR
jgi:hypothetical protein